MAAGPNTLFPFPQVSEKTLYPQEFPQLFVPLAFLKKEKFETYYIAWETHETPRLRPCLDTGHLCSRHKSIVTFGALLTLTNAGRRHEHL